MYFNFDKKSILQRGGVPGLFKDILNKYSTISWDDNIDKYEQVFKDDALRRPLPAYNFTINCG